jgi:hypothetical protein
VTIRFLKNAAILRTALGSSVAAYCDRAPADLNQPAGALLIRRPPALDGASLATCLDAPRSWSTQAAT